MVVGVAEATSPSYTLETRCQIDSRGCVDVHCLFAVISSYTVFCEMQPDGFASLSGGSSDSSDVVPLEEEALSASTPLG